ncbi:MAG: helix-turn-helix transcriptional regulator [Clostridiales bacterium]|nr:helix-turn-helix transcriptional regulator [Clostridiales bacterium]
MQIIISTERLISLRKTLEITQAEAARLIGVSQPAYQRYEAGTRTPSLHVVRDIANAYNVSVDYLTGNSNIKRPDYITVNKNESPILFSIIEQCREYDDEQLKRILDYSVKTSNE